MVAPAKDALREGRKLIAEHQGEDALDLLKAGLAELDAGRKDPDHNRIRAGILLELAKAEQQLANFPKALEYANQARRNYGELGDKLGLANALNQAGSISNLRGDLETAQRNFEEAIAAAPQNRSVLSTAYHGLAFTSFRHGKLEKGLKQVREGLDHARAAGDQDGEGQLEKMQAALYNDRGELEEAEAAYLRAIALFRATGNALNIASGLNNISGVYSKQDRQDEAIASLEESVAIASQAGLHRMEGYGAANLASMLLNTDRDDDVKRYLDRAEEILSDIGDKLIKAYLTLVRADLLSSQGDPEGATQWYNKAITTFRSEDVPLEEAKCYIRWAKALNKAYGPYAGESKLKEAEKIAIRVRSKMLKERIAEVREGKGKDDG